MTQLRALRPRKRRLQRDPDFTGNRLSSFRAVFLRHGLPGLALGIAVLAIPDVRRLFFDTLSHGANSPVKYALIGLGILVGLNLYTWSIDRRWDLAKFTWVAYLGALSVWEEWVFRFVLPQSLESVGASVWTAAILSALIFGALHYFTLRWKWQWCVSAFLGGLYFSYNVELHGNLLFVAAIHWVATTFNTPRPPGYATPDAPENG